MDHAIVPVYWDHSYGAAGDAADTTRKANEIAASLRKHPIQGIDLRGPKPASIDDVLAVHSPEYVTAILTGSPKRLAHGAGFVWDDGLREAVFASTGGVIAAALHAYHTGGVAGSLSSGLHHAKYAEGEGYCTINGLAVAAVRAIADGARDVLIVDFDAHCGGGTASLIATHPQIRQIDVSISTYDQYRSRPDARLEIVAGDYLTAITHMLDSVDVDSVDLVLYNAGMDPHCRAGSGAWGVETEVLADRESIVFGWIAQHDLPAAFVLAGGYTSPMEMEELVALHRFTISEAAWAGSVRARRVAEAA